MVESHVLRPALALIVLISLIGSLSTTASATRSATFPTQLVGVWKRTITAADVKRAHAKHLVA